MKKKKISKIQPDRSYNETELYFSLMEKSGVMRSQVGIGA